VSPTTTDVSDPAVSIFSMSPSYTFFGGGGGGRREGRAEAGNCWHKKEEDGKHRAGRGPCENNAGGRRQIGKKTEDRREETTTTTEETVRRMKRGRAFGGGRKGRGRRPRQHRETTSSSVEEGRLIHHQKERELMPRQFLQRKAAAEAGFWPGSRWKGRPQERQRRAVGSACCGDTITV